MGGYPMSIRSSDSFTLRNGVTLRAASYQTSHIYQLYAEREAHTR